jgi:hypothetical protein
MINWQLGELIPAPGLMSHPVLLILFCMQFSILPVNTDLCHVRWIFKIVVNSLKSRGARIRQNQAAGGCKSFLTHIAPLQIQSVMFNMTTSTGSKYPIHRLTSSSR